MLKRYRFNRNVEILLKMCVFLFCFLIQSNFNDFRLNDTNQGWFFPPHLGEKWKFGWYFPPISEGSGGKIWWYFPPISEGSGGKIWVIFPPHGGKIKKILGKFSPHMGGKSRKPYGKLHFSINIAKIFACGALMLPTPTLIRELAAGGEKMSFEVHFDRFPWFIFPPFLTPLGGKFLVSPQIWGVWGENWKTVSPHRWGEKTTPGTRGDLFWPIWLRSGE